MNYIKKTGYFWVLAGIILCVASVAHAEAPVCFLKGSGITTAPTGTPCSDAKTAYDGTKTLIDFNDGCTGSKTVDLLFQQEPTSKSAIFGYQVSMRFDAAEFSDPVCSPDPASYFFDNALTECPATHQASGQTYVFTGESNFTEGHENDYPADMPNVILMRVAFTPHITAGATGTFTQFTQSQGKRTKVIDPGSAEIQTGLVDADAICSTPPEKTVYAQSKFSSVQSVPQAGCTASSGSSTITLSYSLPTQCDVSGNIVNCADTTACKTPGVTITRTAPSVEVLTAYTTQTSFTDTGNITDPTTTYSYEIKGVCSAGVGTSDAAATANTTPACGVVPVLSVTSIGSQAYAESISAGDAACGSYLNGIPITISGTVSDGDGELPSVVTLAYGNSNTFPQTVTADLSGSNSTSFTVNIPGDDVSSEEDLFWAVWATDSLMTTVGVAVPSTYSGDINSAAFISADCINMGTRLDFISGSEPYPNQMPFRSGGQILILGFEINESAIVTMRIYAPDGTLIRQIENSSSAVRSSAAPTPNVCNWQEGCSWDGTTYLGTEYASNGLYIVNIYAIGTGQNFANQTINYTKGIVVMK